MNVCEFFCFSFIIGSKGSWDILLERLEVGKSIFCYNFLYNYNVGIGKIVFLIMKRNEIDRNSYFVR